MCQRGRRRGHQRGRRRRQGRHGRRERRGGVGGTSVVGGAASAIVDSHFLSAQRHSSRAGSLKRGDVLEIVLQQPSEKLDELGVGQLLQVAKCLVVHLISKTGSLQKSKYNRSKDKQIFEMVVQHNATMIQRSPCSPGVAPAPTMLDFLAFLSSAVWKITGSPTIPF